jgi:hypothetical protein
MLDQKLDNSKTNVIVSIDPQLQEMSGEYQMVVLHELPMMRKHKELFSHREARQHISSSE